MSLPAEGDLSKGGWPLPLGLACAAPVLGWLSSDMVMASGFLAAVGLASGLGNMKTGGTMTGEQGADCERVLVRSSAPPMAAATEVVSAAAARVSTVSGGRLALRWKLPVRSLEDVGRETAAVATMAAAAAGRTAVAGEPGPEAAAVAAVAFGVVATLLPSVVPDAFRPDLAGGTAMCVSDEFLPLCLDSEAHISAALSGVRGDMGAASMPASGSSVLALPELLRSRGEMAPASVEGRFRLSEPGEEPGMGVVEAECRLTQEKLRKESFWSLLSMLSSSSEEPLNWWL
jgi:hypothetical protein